jgi:hypothetical protein
MQTINLYPHKEYIDQTVRFAEVYQIVDFIFPPDEKPNLKPKNERICRFCGLRQPDTKFKRDAHLIPESLGNKTLLSDFECDKCNHFFGLTFENELSNYLGIYRTLTRTNAKGGIPTFTAPSEVIKAKAHRILEDDTIILSREDMENGAIEIDKETGETRIRFKKNAFSPLRVYKSILKVALSIISEDEITKDYKIALDFLMGRNKNKLTGCLMSGYSLPFGYSFTPHAYLFKKKDNSIKAHTHVLALYFQNLIFSLPIPLNTNDLFFYNQKESINLALYPPLFPQANQDLLIKSFVDDFSSDEKVRGQEDEIVINLDPEDLAQTHVFDSNTGERYKTAFNPSEIKNIIIRTRNEPINPEELFNKVSEATKNKKAD